MSSCGTVVEARSRALSSASTACEGELRLGCRWADIADISEDEGNPEDLPMSRLLDRELQGTAGEVRETSECCSSETPQQSDQDAQEPVMETTAQQLNANAPDFIPTLSMVCPLVEVYCVNPTELPLGSQQVLAAVPVQVVAGPPAWPTVWDRRGPAHSRKLTRTRKSRPAALQILGSRQQQPAGQQCQADSAGSSAVVQQQGSMPEATEEEWRHRLEMRERSVALGKSTAVYRWYESLKCREEREEGEPMTPNPKDRSVSKRHWKYLVQCWRTALYNLYVEDGSCSTNLGDDGQSTVTTLTTETADRSILMIDGEDAASST